MSTAGAGAGEEPTAGDTDAVQDPQIVRSIESWMRAYPRRWRSARGEELADLVVDLAGPEARHLGGRAALDLVRGGWATRWRRDARLKHVMPLAGEPLVEGTLLAWDVPVERASARSALHWAVLFSGAVVALSVAVSVKMRWSAAVPILLVALVLGVLAATMARRRLIRLLGECPAQPHRVLRPVSAAGRVRVLVWFMVTAYVAWLDLTVPYSLGLSVLMGAAALILLPGSVAALLFAGHAQGADLAGHDVWLIAVRGRLPALDQPVPAMRPQRGPVPEGAVVQPRRPADPPYPALP